MANRGPVFLTPGRIAITADELWNDLGDPASNELSDGPAPNANAAIRFGRGISPETPPRVRVHIFDQGKYSSALALHAQGCRADEDPHDRKRVRGSEAIGSAEGIGDYDRRPRRSPSIAAGHLDGSCG
jgi:hypothetical protein